MPVRPIINPDTIDLSRVIVPREEYRELLRQRGTFELIDGVLHLDFEQDLVIGYKDIRADDWWSKDHIPGRPIFPGCLMLEGAAQVTTYHFLRKKPELIGSFIGFSSIEKTRFRATVEPDCRLLTVGRLHRFRERLFTYEAQGFVDGKVVFEGFVSGMVIEGPPSAG